MTEQTITFSSEVLSPAEAGVEVPEVLRERIRRSQEVPEPGPIEVLAPLVMPFHARLVMPDLRSHWPVLEQAVASAFESRVTFPTAPRRQAANTELTEP